MEAKTIKKRSFTLDEKRKVVEESRRTSISAAAKKYSIDRQNIRKWRENIKEIVETADEKGSKKRRIAGGGRKPKAQLVEDELYSWFKEEYQQKKHSVSRKQMLFKAREIYANLDQGEEETKLSFSKGWLDRFLDRHNIVLRRTTTVCQQPPADYVEKIAKYIMYVRRKLSESAYQLNQIINCDETPLWLDPAASTTLANRGDKDVPTSSNTGHTKLRITVMLTARADGTKYPPYVLLNRKRPIPEVIKKFNKKLVLKWAGKSWMDDEFTADYLKRVIGSQLFAKRLLIWDSFRCHLSESTKKVLKELKLDVAVIPGGCTKFLAPADVSWNKPVKQKFHEKHDQWLSGGNLPLTKGGKLRPPPLEEYLQWLVDSWDELSPELIKKSFKTTGNSVAVDGSEDSEIHCFKPDGPCPQGGEILKDLFNEFVASQQPAELPDVVPEPFYSSDQESIDNEYDSDSEPEVQY